MLLSLLELPIWQISCTIVFTSLSDCEWLGGMGWGCSQVFRSLYLYHRSVCTSWIAAMGGLDHFGPFDWARKWLFALEKRFNTSRRVVQSCKSIFIFSWKAGRVLFTNKLIYWVSLSFPSISLLCQALNLLVMVGHPFTAWCWLLSVLDAYFAQVIIFFSWSGFLYWYSGGSVLHNAQSTVSCRIFTKSSSSSPQQGIDRVQILHICLHWFSLQYLSHLFSYFIQF